MHRLAAIPLDKARQNEIETALSKASNRQLPPSSAKAITTLMAQTAAYFPHQPLTPETSTVWLARWAELTKTFGLDVFQDALSKVVHRSEFIPLPAKIEAECRTIQGRRENERRMAELREEQDEWDRARRQRPEDFISISEVVSEAKRNVDAKRA